MTITVLKPKDIADMLGKSVTWVYRNARELGASRIGGSWIFTQEGLEYALQRGQKLESDAPLQGQASQDNAVRDKKRSPRIRGGSKEGGSEKREEAAARHGLDDFL